MNLPTTPTTGVIDSERLRIFLYGMPKIGKTSWGTSHDSKTLVLSWDGNYTHLKGVYGCKVESWSEFLAALALVPASDFKWIVIDTADLAFRACQALLKAKLKIEHESELGYAKAYHLIAEEWIRVITRIHGLNRGVIWISHAVEKEEDKRTFYRSTMPDRALIALTSQVDVIGYAAMSGKDRVVHFRSNSRYDAGDYTGLLPEVMPLDRSKFQAIFANQQTKGYMQ